MLVNVLGLFKRRAKKDDVAACNIYIARLSDYDGRTLGGKKYPLIKDALIAVRDCDLIIVDTPTALENSPEGVKELILASDLVLIPSRPTVDDVGSVKTLMAATRALGKNAAFVLNQVDARVKEVEMARQALVKHGHLLASSIPASIEIQRAMSAGMGIVETKGRGAGEVEAVWTEVARLLGIQITIMGEVVNG